MRPVMLLGSTLATLLVASACATSGGGSMSSRYGSAQAPQLTSVSLSGAARDSAIAQLFADREGPRVSIRAQVSSFADSRRVRGIFHVEDDAYVVVGHIDADGVVRIAFPNEPSDDGFVRGDRTYQTSEFFAGFNTEYRFRAATSFYARGIGPTLNSYDGRLGYVFIIASWRPMHSDRFQTGNVWDSYELLDESYMRDPRPAIEELAALLAGDNREAYTVKFARFFDTQTYGGYGSIASAYSAGYCAGYEPFGFESSPFGAFGSGFYGYGSVSGFGGADFRYRGSNYYYDAGGDCYRRGFTGGFGLGYRLVQQPIPTNPSRPRAFDVTGHRPPPAPQALPGHFFPTTPVNAAATDGQIVQHSPEYRQRGLITDDAPSTGPIRRQPRVEGQTPGEVRTRPSIDEMVNRRQGGSQQSPRTYSEPLSPGETRGFTRPQPRDNPQSEPSPRMQAPERTSPPTRTEPAPRMQAPERTAPPAGRSEPRSEPVSRPQPPERPATPPPAASAPPRAETPVKPPK
jgi:hypothetical protein